MSNIIEERKLLTPELARELLKKNDPRQRTLNYSWAYELARDITNKDWDSEVNSDPIDINTDGLMQNGQHRCMAVIIANEPIYIRVRSGCPKEWFDYYDRNRGRTVVDLYQGKYAVSVNSLVAFCISYNEGAALSDAICGMIRQTKRDGKWAKVNPTRNEKLRYIAKHEDELCYYAQLGEKVSRQMPGSNKVMFVKALWFLNKHGADKQLLKELVDDLCESIPYNKNLIVLREWANRRLREYSVKHVRPEAKQSFMLMCALWDAYFEKNVIKSPKRYVDKCFDKYNLIVENERSKRA